MGGGAPYAFEHTDPNSVAVISLFFGMRLGARVTRRLSLALEPGVLATPKVASTAIAIDVPPGQSPPTGVPQPLAVISPTFGVHPFRFIEVAVGPTLAGGILVMGGGTARLAVHIPIGAKGIRLAPAVETFALVGDRTTLATLIGTFGVEL